MPRHPVAFLVPAALVLAIDQLTKQWALSALADGPVDLVGSLRLRLVFNDGAAFSMGGGRTGAIALIGFGVAGVIAFLGLRAHDRFAAVAFGTIFGGATGNLADRAFRAGDGFLGGRVVDMIDLQWWPVFNVADTALWVGIGLLLLGYRRSRDDPRPAAARP